MTSDPPEGQEDVSVSGLPSDRTVSWRLSFLAGVIGVRFLTDGPICFPSALWGASGLEVPLLVP